LCFTIYISSLYPISSASASGYFSFILLSEYELTADIGCEFYITVITSNGRMPSWKSSKSKIASVNTYGKVTAKKAGTTIITAKIRNAEASCKVVVNKTRISISKTSAYMEHGEILRLCAITSNGSTINWKSGKRSIAEIDENGTVTAKKPGETLITASADGSSASCKIIVKSPVVKLSRTRLTLYRGQTTKIDSSISSGIRPVWKTNKKSIALVDEEGLVTAIKHGTAIITATVDRVTKSCEVIVEKPTISLNFTELILKTGHTSKIYANVSSGNSCTWSSSNSNVASVDSSGMITAMQKGKAYIYASEDGSKARCSVRVTK
jgi:uncharacterized protein YjdB